MPVAIIKRVRQWVGFSTLLGLLLSTFISTGPASALETRLQYAEIGPDGTSNSIFTPDFQPNANALDELAFNQSAKRLFASTTHLTFSIYGFDASTEGIYVPLGGNFPLPVPEMFNDPIDVDSSGLGSDGNIYVFEGSTNSDIHGYDPSGSALPGFPVSLTGIETRGGGVDPSGNLWIYDRVAKLLRRYSSAGVADGTTADVSIAITNPFSSVDFAFDANGDLYVTDGSSPVYRFTAASGYTTSAKAAPGAAETSGTAQDIEVDTSTHILYRLRSNEAEAYDATGKHLYTFGSTPLVNYNSMAIDQSTDSIFLGSHRDDPESSTKDTESIRVFGTYGPVVFFTLDEATNLTGAHATLSGTVNPDGATITECRFEYGMTKAYGQSAPCVGAIPADSTPHPVTATLSDLVPNGRTYHYRLVVKGSTGGKSVTEDETFVTANTLFTKPASGLTDSSATLNATIDPDGAAHSDCRFEYGMTTLYGQSVPCNPPAGAIPADTNTHVLSASVSGLSSNTTYHFRVLATNTAGTYVGEDKTFSALGSPLVYETEASPVAEISATLKAQIDTRQSPTDYHFEWGTDDSYGNRFPASGELSAGSEPSQVAVSTDIAGLAKRQTYHYRIVATNGFGVTEGPDQIFTTQIENSDCLNGAIRTFQTSEAMLDGPIAFPDCMALEMVTPPTKFNQYAQAPSFSANGERVKFMSVAALADTPKLGTTQDVYVASRTGNGWTTTSTATPPEYVVGSGAAGLPCAFSPDLSQWATWASTDSQAKLGITTAFHGDLNGNFFPLSPLLVPLNPGMNKFTLNGSACEGASTDASHFFFVIQPGGLSDGTTEPGATYLPGDPFNVRKNVYEAYLDAEGKPSVVLLQRDSDGVVHGAKCGAVIGNGTFTPVVVGARGAVSPDASRVYFSTRVAQPEGLPCSFSNRMRILERLRTSSGIEITEPIEVECSRVAPPCSGIDGDDNYQAASLEGDRIYFTTTRQLVDSDLDTTNDLYLYDATSPEGEQLTQVSLGEPDSSTPGEGANVLGVTEVAGDGSRAYFVAEDQLTTSPSRLGGSAELGKPNLYLYEVATGQTTFIGTLASADKQTWVNPPGLNEASAVPILGEDLEDQGVGGDGHILVFFSQASLVPGDDDGGYWDVYQYDSLTGALTLISKAALSGTDGGPFNVAQLRAFPETGPQALSTGVVSEDGLTIAFSTAEPLDPVDKDGFLSPYVWRDGSLDVIPVRNDEEVVLSGRPVVSMNGNAVAFSSDRKLLPQDGDAAVDVYVLRIDGGFPPEVPPAPCVAEACQGRPTPQPAAVNAPSQTPGAGNPSQPKTCRKGFARRKGRCVKQRANQKKRAGKAKKRGAKRTGKSQGGGK